MASQKNQDGQVDEAAKAADVAAATEQAEAERLAAEQAEADRIAAEAAAQAAAPPVKKIIEFVGFSGTYRTISRDDLLRVVDAESIPPEFQILEWNPNNGHRADASMLSDEIIMLLTRDPELRLVQTA